MINLSDIQRPSRYIDHELNAIRKSEVDLLRVALAFPDVYDVGMSHLGLKVLYHIVNGLPYAAAERIFHPWLDMREAMLRSNEPLRSLETNRPLSEFHVVGLSLQYELSYTTALSLLDLGQIPLKSIDRTEAHPLVLAGGPCTVNPLPMAPFIDAILIGDGEDAIVEILSLINNMRLDRSPRHAVLKALSNIEGVYVPLIHGTSPDRKIKRRYVASLEDAPFPTAPVLPYNQIVHDRVAIEVSRGCPMGCRFCQAGLLYRPVRERSMQKVLELATASIASTGYEELAFTSLSAGDYSCLGPLIEAAIAKFSHKRVSVSLPSIRVAAIDRDILRSISSIRKTGFTIAPEAGTERLRAAINKGFTHEEFLRSVETLFTEGWLTLKLYYMIGLPTETDEDVKGITEMVREAFQAAKGKSRRPANITVSVSPFVPKVHTPFQWAGFEGIERITAKRDYLRANLKRATFKSHDLRTSMLEAAMARGDASSASLVEAAYRAGCVLDAWSESFDMNKWRAAMEASGIDAEAMAMRRLEPGAAPLPWDFVDTGITEDFLLRELKRAGEGRPTMSCLKACSDCGLGCRPALQETAASIPSPSHKERPLRKPIRVRARFIKGEALRFISHRELMTAMTRALSRAEIALEFSQGFNPSPKLSFGPPLPVGVEGTSEYLDMEVLPYSTLTELRERLNAKLPEGLSIEEAVAIEPKEPSLQAFITKYVYEVRSDRAAELCAAFALLPEAIVQREKGAIDVRPMFHGYIEQAPDRVLVTLADLDASRRMRLDETLGAIFGAASKTARVSRTGMFGLDKAGKWVSPLRIPEAQGLELTSALQKG